MTFKGEAEKHTLHTVLGGWPSTLLTSTVLRPH